MTRKKWTPQVEITDALLKFREKRKWQLAFRRYVLEKKPGLSYSIYFGLDIENLRKWIELQFNSALNWDNFGSAWQFEHIVPVTYFDFSNDADLKLCWNFINIRVERLDTDKTRGNRMDIVAAKGYFEKLHEKTGFTLCLSMIEKINLIEVAAIQAEPALESFILQNKSYLETLSTLDPTEFNSLNSGTSLDDILMEREILKKFGS
jgi:hypothetical protein